MLGFLGLEFFIFPSKSFNAAGRIHQLLFTGVERVALGADFNPDFFLG